MCWYNNEASRGTRPGAGTFGGGNGSGRRRFTSAIPCPKNLVVMHEHVFSCCTTRRSARPPVVRRPPAHASPYDAGFPELLVIWPCVAFGVGNAGRNVAGSVIGTHAFGRLCARHPYFPTAFTKSSGDPTSVTPACIRGGRILGRQEAQVWLSQAVSRSPKALFSCHADCTPASHIMGLPIIW